MYFHLHLLINFLYIQMGRWEEAQNLIEQLWGKAEVEVALEELRSTSEGTEDDISWSELVQAPYFKGDMLLLAYLF